MLTLTILALDKESVVYTHHYKWLKSHMHEPLKVLSISFKHDTDEIFSISILKSKSDVITVFVNGYNTVYRLEGELPRC